MRAVHFLLLFLANACLLLAPRPAAAVDEGCVNAGCHAQYGKAPFVHEAIDNCTDCHKLAPGRSDAAHEAKAKQPSTVKDYPVPKKTPDLCWECHDNDAEKTDNLHPPYEDGDCGECHDMHQSKHPKQLKAPVAETCYGCHDEIQAKVEDSRVAHDPLDSKESCLNCHAHHGADPGKYLKAPSVMKLCGEECHDDLVAEIEAIPADHRHGPVQKGECQACHDVHGSPFAKLLRGNYPTGNYAPWSSMTFKACFGKCHDTKMFTEKGATGFSTAEKSLHYLHTNRQKGRTCRMCHEPHASPEAHLLRAKVPFGKWKFDMTWKPGQGEAAASCAPACHGEKKYNGGLKAPPAEKKD